MCQAMGKSNMSLDMGPLVTHGIMPFEENLS